MQTHENHPGLALLRRLLAVPAPSGREAGMAQAVREELDALRDKMDLRLVHVLETAPEGWEGETGFVTRDMLERHLPADQRRAVHYFLCGPPPMLKAVEDGLAQLGVPSDHVKVEIFNLV